jgi:chaperone modulatory protein CbpM
MNIEICEALRIDERGAIDWTQLIELSGVPESDLRELVDEGALVPVDLDSPMWSFDAQALVRARAASRLRRELDLDVHALAVVLGFVARIEALEAEVRALRAGVAQPIGR